MARQLELLGAHADELQRDADDLRRSLSGMQETLRLVALRTEQLTAIDATDAAIADRREDVAPAFDIDHARSHAARAVAGAALELDPFPHVIVDEVLPPDLYEALIEAIPPRVFFEDRPVNKQQVSVPPMLAPAHSRQLWKFVCAELIQRSLVDVIVDKFRAPLTSYLQRYWPDLEPGDRALRLAASEGRVLLRRPGYAIPPHRDPRWGFITLLLYLARPGDPGAWGTQLYRVPEDSEAPSAQPFWMHDVPREVVADVRFVPNRAVIFLNSSGCHGASIPSDAPPDFERYIYQCRVGPSPRAIPAQLARLPQELRPLWEGKERY